MKKIKPKIKFHGFTEVSTGGGCTAMEFAMPFVYRILVTDEGEVPLGDVCDVSLHADGYIGGVSLDFKKQKLVRHHRTMHDRVEAHLQTNGLQLYFWNKGHRVVGGVQVNWKRKSLEVLS